MGIGAFDSIVAGAGIWGCTVARRLADTGRRVLVLEKRAGVGGNVRCEIDPETGIEVHKYGSHIFHTHIPQVWKFVNQFTSFNGYQHKVLAWTKARWEDISRGEHGERGPGEDWQCRRAENKDGAMYHLPLGLILINKFFGVELKPGDVDEFLDDPNPKELNHRCSPSPLTFTSGLSPRRQAIFDAFFRGYTSKQWGTAPEDIDPSIIKRVPVRSNYDTNYFNDYWQGIPSDGYNALFERLLDHPNITMQTSSSLKLKSKNGGFEIFDEISKTSTPLSTSASNLQSLSIYYSGPIDALFDYKFGTLPWRTLRFEQEVLPIADYQGTSVVNYPDIVVPYTRIHEFKHYHPEKLEYECGGGERKMVSRWGYDAAKTIVMREYSATWQQGDEPYYPINNDESAALLARYQEEVEKFNHRCSTSNLQPPTFLIIGGRLGQYKYFDMDKSMEAALQVEI